MVKIKAIFSRCLRFIHYAEVTKINEEHKQKDKQDNKLT